MTCEDFQDLAALLALGSLDPSDREPLSAHLAGCPPCRTAYNGMSEAAAELPFALPAAALPPHMKDRLLARLARSKPLAPPPLPPLRSAPYPRLLVGSLVACSILFALGMDSARQRAATLEQALAEQRGLVAGLREAGSVQQATIDKLHAESKGQAARLAVLQMQDMRMATLPGLVNAVGAKAHVFWSPAKHAWLVTCTGMPATHQGKTYQLWAVTPKGAKVNMGTFKADATGNAVIEANWPHAGMLPTAAAVSLEPAGGMPQPTGPIVMMGVMKL